MCRSRPQDMEESQRCCFTSLAPNVLPSRRCSSLTSSFLMNVLPFDEMDCPSLKDTSRRRTLEKVALRVAPLKGVVAYW